MPPSITIPWRKDIFTPAFTGLLDQSFASGATAAYSLRLLRADHSGGLVRVRADDNGTNKGEADVLPRLQPDGSLIIALDSQIVNLNTTAKNRDLGIGPQGQVTLGNLVESGGANYDAFVSKWYDQSGNSNDASNSSASEQPQIVSSGSVIKENGRPALEFDGIDDSLESDYGVEYTQPCTYFVNAKVISGARIFWAGGSFSPNQRQLLYIANNRFTPFAGETNLRTGLFNTDNNLHTLFFNGSNSVWRVNGTQESNGDAGSNSTIGVNIGAGAGTFGKIRIPEFLFYANDQSANRDKIESNINNYYSIF